MFALIIIVTPNTPKKPKKELPEEAKLILISTKNVEKNLKRRFQKLRNFKTRVKQDKWLKIKGLWYTFSLVIFATILGWTAVSITNENISDPLFGRVSQDIRRDGIDFSLGELEYFEDINSIEDITFNSLLVLKFEMGLPFTAQLMFHAELVPEETNDEESKLLMRTHRFSSRSYRGSFKDKQLFFPIDFDSSESPIIPGNYKLKVYSTTRGVFLYSGRSPKLSFEVTIEKDSLTFNPNYYDDPLRSTRRGSIYSIYRKDILGYENYFNTRVEDSLGKAIKGNFSLYLTQREGNAPVYKKLTDYVTKNDGIISFKTVTRNHYKEYQRGKIFYDGEQTSPSFYKTTTHFEDCEIAENKFLHTSDWPDIPEYTYDGVDWNLYNTNNFTLTSHLYYHHEFSPPELQWTKSPSYSFDSGPPDIIYLDVSDDLSTYIESPVLGYLGTVADYAMLSYRYELFNYGTPNNEIWVDLKSQVFRDGNLIYEQSDFSGYYKILP
jgi:hypothetical protein